MFTSVDEYARVVAKNFNAAMKYQAERFYGYGFTRKDALNAGKSVTETFDGFRHTAPRARKCYDVGLSVGLSLGRHANGERAR
ncbi:hypothetical protein LBMAG44_16750 [Gemmatimonadota bacterium]|nr:hypothetical protein LBMAG44_16750 [Gemmatimonadota bacterium]